MKKNNGYIKLIYLLPLFSTLAITFLASYFFSDIKEAISPRSNIISVNFINKDKADNGLPYRTDQFVIKLKENTRDDINFSSKNVLKKENVGIKRINNLNKKYKVKRMEKVFPKLQKKSKNEKLKNLDLAFRVKIKQNKNIEKIVKEYSSLPEVEYAEPAYKIRLNMTPNDTYYNDLWGMTKVKAPETWDVNSGAGVTVAVIDTGVDYNHEDLSSNIWTNPGETGGGKETNGIDDDANGYIDDWRGWDFYWPLGDNNPMDPHGHGTHVAGTIAAIANNSKGVIGLSYSVKIMPIRIFGAATNSDVANAITYAADMGAEVSSNSWTFYKNIYSSLVNDAINYAHDTKDQVIVFASGNDDDNVAYYFPANSPKVISVAASNESDGRASFSNYGTKIDVAAPGTNIVSTYPSNNYAIASGTSMSTPHVSALAAILKSIKPALTNEEVREIIHSTAKDLGTTGKDIYFGEGRIDSLRATQCVNSLNTVADASPIYKYSSNIGIWDFKSCSVAYKSKSKVYTSGSWSYDKTKFSSGDVNGDGKEDIVALYDYGNADTGIWIFTKTNNSYSPSRWWLSGNGKWSWQNTNLQVGDVNNDNNDDIILTYKYSSTIGIWNFISNGTGITSYSKEYTSGPWSYDKTKFASGDINGDGREDLVALYNYGNNNTGIWAFEKTDAGYLHDKWWLSEAGNWSWYNSGLQVGDVNNNATEDIIIPYKYSSTIGIWNFISNGTGITSYSKEYTSGPWSYDKTKFASGDINGDGREDLVAIYNYGNNQTGFWVFKRTVSSYSAENWWSSSTGSWSWDYTNLQSGNTD